MNPFGFASSTRFPGVVISFSETIPDLLSVMGDRNPIRLDTVLTLLEAWMLFRPLSEKLINENVHDAIHDMMTRFRVGESVYANTYCHPDRQSILCFPHNQIRLCGGARVHRLRKLYAEAMSDPSQRQRIHRLLDPPPASSPILSDAHIKRGGLLCFVERGSHDKKNDDDEAVLDMFYVFFTSSPTTKRRRTDSLVSHGIRIHELLLHCCDSHATSPPPKAVLLEWDNKESVRSALFPLRGNSESRWFLDADYVPSVYMRALRSLIDVTTTPPWTTFVKAKNMSLSIDRVFSRLRNEQGVFPAGELERNDDVVIALSRQLSYDAMYRELATRDHPRQGCSMISKTGEALNRLMNALNAPPSAHMNIYTPSQIARLESVVRRVHVLAREDILIGACLEVASQQNGIIVSASGNLTRASSNEEEMLRILIKKTRRHASRENERVQEEEIEGLRPSSIDYVLKQVLNWSSSYPT